MKPNNEMNFEELRKERDKFEERMTSIMEEELSNFTIDNVCDTIREVIDKIVIASRNRDDEHLNFMRQKTLKLIEMIGESNFEKDGEMFYFVHLDESKQLFYSKITIGFNHSRVVIYENNCYYSKASSNNALYIDVNARDLYTKWVYKDKDK